MRGQCSQVAEVHSHPVRAKAICAARRTGSPDIFPANSERTSECAYALVGRPAIPGLIAYGCYLPDALGLGADFHEILGSPSRFRTACWSFVTDIVRRLRHFVLAHSAHSKLCANNIRRFSPAPWTPVRSIHTTAVQGEADKTSSLYGIRSLEGLDSAGSRSKAEMTAEVAAQSQPPRQPHRDSLSALWDSAFKTTVQKRGAESVIG